MNAVKKKILWISSLVAFIWLICGAVVAIIDAMEAGHTPAPPPSQATIVTALPTPVVITRAKLVFQEMPWNPANGPHKGELQEWKAWIVHKDAMGRPIEFGTKNGDGTETQWRRGPDDKIGTWHVIDSRSEGLWGWDEAQSTSNSWSGKMKGVVGDSKNPLNWVDMTLEEEVVQTP